MRRSRCLSSISCANSRFICLTCWYRNCESQESPKIRIMISKPMQNVHQLSTLNKQNEKSNTSLTPHNKESKQAKKITWPCELYFTNHFKTPKKWNETKKKNYPAISFKSIITTSFEKYIWDKEWHLSLDKPSFPYCVCKKTQLIQRVLKQTRKLFPLNSQHVFSD